MSVAVLTQFLYLASLLSYTQVKQGTNTMLRNTFKYFLYIGYKIVCIGGSKNMEIAKRYTVYAE